MSDFQLLMLQIALLGINIAIILASAIIGSAINNLAKAIKEKKSNE